MTTPNSTTPSKQRVPDAPPSKPAIPAPAAPAVPAAPPPKDASTTSIPPEPVRKEKPKANNMDEIIDEFDYSYIPDELKDLICGPETAAAAEYEQWGRDGQFPESVSRKEGKFGRKKLTDADEEEEDGEDDDWEDYDEDEEYEEESSDSNLTMSDDDFSKRKRDSDDEGDSDESDPEERKKRRFLIGTHSFMELRDPGLADALVPKEETPEKVIEGKKRQEKKQYIDICKELGVQPCRKFMAAMNTDTVDLNHYELGPEEIIAICKMMENNTKVKYLNLSGNPAGLEGGLAIARMIENNYTLTHLNISSTEILDAFKNICAAVALNITLEFLDASRNKLGDREMQGVADFLKETSTLQELYLRQNKIRDVGLGLIGLGLKENSSLKVIDLGINEIRGEKKAMPFFQFASEHPALAKIDLFNNTLKDNMAKGISRVLGNNKQMEFLNIAFNLFDNPGAKSIGGGLRKNFTMVELIAGPNEWRQDGASNLLTPLLNEKIAEPMETMDFGWLFDVYHTFLKAEAKVLKLRPDIKIIRGNGFGQWKAKGPNVKALVIRRAKVVCDNFATPLGMLIDELRKEPKKMNHKEFKKFIKSCNLYKDKKMTESFLKNFALTPFDVDCEGIIEAYDIEFPKKTMQIAAAKEKDGGTDEKLVNAKEMKRERDASIHLMKW